MGSKVLLLPLESAVSVIIAGIGLGILPVACVGTRDVLLTGSPGDDGGSQVDSGGGAFPDDADQSEGAAADSSSGGQGVDAPGTGDDGDAADHSDVGDEITPEGSPYYDDVATIPETGVPEAAPPVLCPPPAQNTDTLPFVVDDQGVFVPSGFEGDAMTPGVIGIPSTPGDPSCSGMRSSPSAVGNCHTVIYSPLPGGAGWAGVVWQHPANNWGTMPGYAIPAGATRVSFSARGSRGNEVVTFLVGGTLYGSTPTAAAPCADPLKASTKLTLSNAWNTYSIDLGGASYEGGVLSAFGFNVTVSSEPGGRQVTFYIDDIQWQ